MRSFLWLAAALIASLHCQNIFRMPVTKFEIPGGLPDGSILTFYFKHIGKDESPESVNINFYDLPAIEIDKVYNITAHLRIDRILSHPVYSNTLVGGVWLNQTNVEQDLDEMPPSDGWWRVDVIKRDKYNMNVFFQGFWSGLRTFERSLDDIMTAYVFSEFVDQQSVKIHLKVPNAYVAPFSEEHIKPDARITSLRYFPIGASIEMTTALYTSRDAKEPVPALFFSPTDGGLPFLKIFQIWEDDTQMLYISSSDRMNDDAKTLCSNDKPHGHLQHLSLMRTQNNEMALSVHYKPSIGSSGVACSHTLSLGVATYLQHPFDIITHEGAALLHVDISVTP